MSAKSLPLQMFLIRKSIRHFPNDVVVGVYYAQDLDQYLAISTSENGSINVSEVFLDDAGDVLEEEKENE